MRNLLYLKVATILAFLLIVFPGKLAVINGILIPVVLLTQVLELFEKQSEFFKIWPEFILLILTTMSLIFLFTRSKKVVLMCFVIQYFLLFYYFQYIYLNYWYYTLPTSIYFILSLTVLYVLFVKRHPEKGINS
jgi:hypothetical protein